MGSLVQFIESGSLSARHFEGMRRPLGLRFAAILGVMALAAFGCNWLDLQRAPPLSYTVEGGRVDANGAIAANGSVALRLRFSDGTEVAFLEGARVRLKVVDEQGARVALSGKASVTVVHPRGSRWLFDAGPFLITVTGTGTAFTAEWREADERLAIALKTGSIAVSGPLSARAISLRPGQRLVLSLREEVLIRRSDSVAASTVPRYGDPRWTVGARALRR